nr:hypothetical protein [Tanacetum cinerariifolium]
MDLQKKLKVDVTVKKFKARLVIHGFKQKSGIDYFDNYAPVESISTTRLLIAMASIPNLIIHQMDMKIAFLNGDLDEEEADVILGIRIKHESNGIAIYESQYIENVLKKFNYFDCILVSNAMDTSENLMPNNGTQHWQAIQRVLKYLKKTIGYKLTYTSYHLVLEGYTDASKISNTEDNSSTSGWVLLLCDAADKKAEWLKNLLLKIPLWSKPIAYIFIRCDSAATLAKAYSQMYNEQSRHLGVRHNTICELITNRMVSIEFMRS